MPIEGVVFDLFAIAATILVPIIVCVQVIEDL